MLISLSERAQLIMMTSWASRPFSARRRSCVDLTPINWLLWLRTDAGVLKYMRNELIYIDQKQSFHILFTGGRDFFFRYGVTPFWVSVSSFALVRFSRYQNFEVWKMAHFIWSVNRWIIFDETSNFCMKVERSNFILVPNSALSTNVFLQSKCNMHGWYDHASWSWCSASHCWNRVRKPGQLINYARFWPHRWTFAKNRTAHAQTHYWKSTQWQWASFVSGVHRDTNNVHRWVYLSLALFTHDMRGTWCAFYGVSIFSFHINMDPDIPKSNGNWALAHSPDRYWLITGLWFNPNSTYQLHTIISQVHHS